MPWNIVSWSSVSSLRAALQQNAQFEIVDGAAFHGHHVFLGALTQKSGDLEMQICICTYGGN